MLRSLERWKACSIQETAPLFRRHSPLRLWCTSRSKWGLSLLWIAWPQGWWPHYAWDSTAYQLNNECVRCLKEGGGVEGKTKEVTKEERCTSWDRGSCAVSIAKESEAGGLWLVHWNVTSAACWIEVPCPADFNPNSLRNWEQVPGHALRKKQRKWSEKKLWISRQKEISGVTAHPEKLKKEEIKYFDFQSHDYFHLLTVPLFVLNLCACSFNVWLVQACPPTGLTRL